MTCAVHPLSPLPRAATLIPFPTGWTTFVRNLYNVSPTKANSFCSWLYQVDWPTAPHYCRVQYSLFDLHSQIDNFGFRDGGFYCLGCPKLFAKKSMQPTNSAFRSLVRWFVWCRHRGYPRHSLYRFRFFVCLSLIMAGYTIDVLISQLFPDQINYFPETSQSAATKSIGDGGKWSSVHSDTALL